MTDNSRENLKEKTKKGLYWSFFNQFANYGMQFCVGIVMARLLSPSDYGITALPAVFMSVAWIFQNGGLSDALIRKKDLKEEDLSTVFYYSIAIGIVLYLVLFISAPWIAGFYEIPILIPLIRVTALSFLWGPLNTVQNVILKRRLDFKTQTKVSIYTKFFSAFIGITLAYNGYGVWALVASGVLSSILGLLLNWYVVKWYPTTRWSKDSFRYIWGFGNKIMLASLIDTIYYNFTPLFIAKFYTPVQLGLYNRAYGYAMMPSQNISATLQGVTYAALSKMQDDKEALARNYRKMLRVTAFIVFPMMMMLAALSRPLVITIITVKWEDCIILLQILCFSMMLYPIHSINLNLLQVMGRSDLTLRLEIIKKLVGVFVLAMTLTHGLVVFCYGAIVSSLFSLVINTYYTGKLINVGFYKQLGDLVPILILSLSVFIVIYISNLFMTNMLIQIIFGAIVGGLVYLGGALLLDFKELDEVKYMLTRNK